MWGILSWFLSSAPTALFLWLSIFPILPLDAEELRETAEQTIRRVCSQCHAVKINDQCVAGDCVKQRTHVTQGRDWERLTEWMRVFNCRMTDEEQQVIAEHLKAQYPGQPYPLSWTHVASAPSGWNIVSLASIGDYLYMGVEGSGRIFRSPDGIRWEELVDTGQVAVYGITFFNGKIYAGADEPDPDVWSTTDGKNWAKVARLAINEVGITAMGVFREKLYAGTRRGDIYRSSDGVHWTFIKELEEDFGGYTRFFIEFKNHLYTGIEPGGKVYRSSDGVSWTKVNQGFPSAVGVRAVSVFKDSLYVGINSPVQIWKTDNGINWSKIFDPTPEKKYGYVGSMTVFKDYLYAGVHADRLRPNDVFRTKDGIRWEEVGKLGPHTIEAMAVFQGFLYAGALFPPQAWIYRTSGLEPTITSTAVQDLPVEGKVTGSYLDTHTPYNRYEVIEAVVEGEKKSLEHKWKFKIPGGSFVTFAVKAYHSGFPLLFAYSLDDKFYTDMLILSATQEDQTYQFAVLSDLPSGDLYIRAKSYPKGAGRDILHVDHLYVLSEGLLKAAKLKKND